MNFIEHQTIFFKRKHLLNKVTLKSLLEVCRRNGYIVKYYSESKVVFLALNLWNKAKKADSISIVDSNGNTLIFLRDTFSKEKQLYSLAHELGHIILKHEDYSADCAEKEADLFAHYLLSGADKPKLNNPIMPVAFLLTIVIVLTISFSANTNIEQAEPIAAPTYSNYENTIEIENNTVCYFTKSGEVYHIYKDCRYIRNSTQVICATVEHCHKDRLCSACEQRLNSE